MKQLNAEERELLNIVLDAVNQEEPVKQFGSEKPLKELLLEAGVANVERMVLELRDKHSKLYEGFLKRGGRNTWIYDVTVWHVCKAIVTNKDNYEAALIQEIAAGFWYA